MFYCEQNEAVVCESFLCQFSQLILLLFAFLHLSLCLSPTANVTLDPDTAGSWLILSEDQKSVKHQAKRQDLPDNPERFSDRAYVLGHEGFTSGRHFWEVVVGGEGDWAVGVARKSVRRKGPVDCVLQEGICVVSKSEIWPSSTDFLQNEKTKRVRVCLNYTSNQVAFYDGDTGDQIWLLSDLPFSGETVLPFFYGQGHSNVPLILWSYLVKIFSEGSCQCFPSEAEKVCLGQSHPVGFYGQVGI
uniref:B30.2/SPRY domain-containing protein n=1 Tax=Anolis carolinensis TaxID=28377 RepID=G1KUW5_ANOCA